MSCDHDINLIQYLELFLKIFRFKKRSDDEKTHFVFIEKAQNF